MTGALVALFYLALAGVFALIEHARTRRCIDCLAPLRGAGPRCVVCEETHRRQQKLERLVSTLRVYRGGKR